MTAKALSIHSGRFSIHRATFSPGWTPRASSPRATRSTPAATSANVQRRPANQRASREPQRSAARAGSAPILMSASSCRLARPARHAGRGDAAPRLRPDEDAGIPDVWAALALPGKRGEVAVVAARGVVPVDAEAVHVAARRL